MVVHNFKEHHGSYPWRARTNWDARSPGSGENGRSELCFHLMGSLQGHVLNTEPDGLNGNFAAKDC